MDEGAFGVAGAFEAIGGRFVTPVADLVAKLSTGRAIVLDWDGVFNDGRKGGADRSGFSEPDSMGLNLLRYGLWRRDGRLPVVAIVSGEDNPSAVAFAEREHLHAVYGGYHDKRPALADLVDAHGLQPAEVAFVFDDANDLGAAAAVGVRFLVGRRASPLLERYVAAQGLGDYVTGRPGGGGAVREVAELWLGLLGAHDEVVTSRAAFDDDYRSYWAARQAVVTTRRRP